MELELFKYLSAGGDLGLIALAVHLIRQDRRITRLELYIAGDRRSVT